MNTLHILFCEYNTLYYKSRLASQQGKTDQAAVYSEAAFQVLSTMHSFRLTLKGATA